MIDSGSVRSPHANSESALHYDRRVPARQPPFAVQVLIALAAFGVGTGIAEAAGAKNLGTALGIGQIVFAAVCVYLLLTA
jgi:hypothetical protein